MNKSTKKQIREIMLKIINNKLEIDLWTPTQIYKELYKKYNKEVQLRTVTKHLKNMTNDYECGYLDNNKKNTEYIKLLLSKNNYNPKSRSKLNKQTPNYYILTPYSYNFYLKLQNVVKNKREFKQKVSEILENYRIIEICAYLHKLEHSDKKELVNKHIEQFSNTTIKTTFFNEDKVTYNSKDFFLIDGEHVPVEKFTKFLHLMKFSRLMYYFAYKLYPEYGAKLMYLMERLFVGINKESQIKL